MCEIISAADILAEYVSDEELDTEWPHGSKQDAESVVNYAKLLKADNAALRERVAELEAQLRPVGVHDVDKYYFDWTCSRCGTKLLSSEDEHCPCEYDGGGVA